MEFNRQMIEKDCRDNIKALCDVFGPSGFENDCVDLIKEMIQNYNVEMETDVMLNLIAHRKGKGENPKKILIAAHTDEIGLIVRRIDEKGWLWCVTLGGVRPQQLFGKHVKVRTENGTYIDGIVNSTKPGRLESCTEIPPVTEFFVEIGATSRQEAREMGVEVGCPISLDYPVVFLGKDKDRVAGKALDDRMMVFMLIELLKLVSDDEEIPDIYAVFSSQEEVGCRGAKIAAQRIQPDIALALDISIANDLPDTPDRKIVNEVGRGASIKVMDKLSTGLFGAIANQQIVENLKKIARDNQIPYQMECYGDGGTDIDTMQTMNGGIACGGIQVATRYVHSYEMCSITDVVDAMELLYRYVKSLA